MIEERYFQDTESAGRAMALEIGACLAGAIRRQGSASLAVPGGRTPRCVFPALSGQPLAWEKVQVTLTDERWVGADHADSNERLARDELLQGEAVRACFTGLKTPAPSPRAGLAECRARLADFPLPLDAVLLGMGEDGHIASLFPMADWPDPTDASCLALDTPAGGASDLRPSDQRMSLAPQIILGAANIFLILSGAQKRSVYEEAKHPGPIPALPVRLVLHQDKAPITVFLAA